MAKRKLDFLRIGWGEIVSAIILSLGFMFAAVFADTNWIVCFFGGFAVLWGFVAGYGFRRKMEQLDDGET